MTGLKQVSKDLKHPAPYSKKVLAAMKDLLREEGFGRTEMLFVLDPFAGTGKIHDLADQAAGIITAGVEIEPEWASMHEGTVQGDALDLPFENGAFDVIATSPCFGNRMADHHDAQERCKACKGTGTIFTHIVKPDAFEAVWVSPPSTCDKCDGKGFRDHERNTYRHKLGRMPSDGSAAIMQWGEPYRDFHRRFMREADRVLIDGGLFIINIKNHPRKGEEQKVSEWYVEVMTTELGYVLEDDVTFETKGLPSGTNADVRVLLEHVYAFRKGPH